MFIAPAARGADFDLPPHLVAGEEAATANPTGNHNGCVRSSTATACSAAGLSVGWPHTTQHVGSLTVQPVSSNDADLYDSSDRSSISRGSTAAVENRRHMAGAFCE
jgi:hypothetical protein